MYNGRIDTYKHARWAGYICGGTDSLVHLYLAEIPSEWWLKVHIRWCRRGTPACVHRQNGGGGPLNHSHRGEGFNHCYTNTKKRLNVMRKNAFDLMTTAGMCVYVPSVVTVSANTTSDTSLIQAMSTTGTNR